MYLVMWFFMSPYSFYSIPHSEVFIDSFPNTVIPKSAYIEDIDGHMSSFIHNETVPINEHDGSSNVPSTSYHIIPTRTSSRASKQPYYLRDYHCHMLKHNSAPSSKILCPLNTYLVYDSLSLSYRHFSLNISSQIEPQFFHQAVKFETWKAAMQDELDAMEENKNWSVVPLPSDKHQ